MKVDSNSKEIKALLIQCKDGVLSGKIPVYIPLGQARPRPPEFGQFHLQAELFYQISGETYFQFPASEYTLKPNHVLIVPPLVTHFEKVQGNPSSFKNLVAYAGKRYCSVHLAHAGQDKRPTISYIQRRNPSYASHISQYLADATILYETLYKSDYEQRIYETVRLLLATALSHFLLALDTSDPQNSLPSMTNSDPWQEVHYASHLVYEARERVLAAFSDKALSVQLLAEWIGCSADYLSHRYKAETGESLTTYINRIRLERAAELLNESPLSVKEISWACGFSDESYFIRKFSAAFGMTPNLYRRKDRELLPASARRS
jgi:AraC-like DNA-binding protein